MLTKYVRVSRYLKGLGLGWAGIDLATYTGALAVGGVAAALAVTMNRIVGLDVATGT